jgi:bifunctional non-homologous end joining protein LigD
MRTGAPTWPALERRLEGKSGRPVAFLAFDLLHLDGRSLLDQPLVKRRETLRRVLRPATRSSRSRRSRPRAGLFDAIVARASPG